MARALILTDVSQAYHEHEILLTGGSGFLGKVVLALLLDRFPGAKRLHLLMRRGAGVSAGERFEREILASPALGPVVERLGPDFVRGRASVWEGDIARPGCGLEQSAIERMAGRVGLIINCAGLAEFSPPLDEAFASNVDGAEHVAKLARTLGSRLLHASSGYVSGERDGLVEETESIPGFYPRRQGPADASFEARREIDACHECIRQISEIPQAEDGPADAKPAAGVRRVRPREMTERLIALGRQRAEQWGWANAYTYSKSLGEQIIAAEPGLDYAIVRPAMVESAWRFPFPGWIERGCVSAPLMLVAVGGLKYWPVRQDTPLEVVPVDLVAAAILVVGALLMDGHHRLVYHLATADVNPLELGPLVKLLDAEARRRSLANGARHPGLALLDLLIGAPSGGPVRFVSPERWRTRRRRLQKRVERAQRWIGWVRRGFESSQLPGSRSLAALGTALGSLSVEAGLGEQALDPYLPFLVEKRYVFECENIRSAYAQLAARERDLLPWDPERIDWPRYWVHNQVPGIRKWVQPSAERA